MRHGSTRQPAGQSTPRQGKIQIFWFENRGIGLERTLFHRVTIPLEPFDSGLRDEPEIEETEIVFDFMKLGLPDPFRMDGLVLTIPGEDDLEASVYVGSSHNPIDVERLGFRAVGPDLYEISADVIIRFEFENVAPDETFSLRATANFDRTLRDETGPSHPFVGDFLGFLRNVGDKR